MTVTVYTRHVPERATVLVCVNGLDPTPAAGSENATVQATGPIGRGARPRLVGRAHGPVDHAPEDPQGNRWIDVVCASFHADTPPTAQLAWFLDATRFIGDDGALN